MNTSVIQDELYQEFLQLMKEYEQRIQRGEYISFEDYMHQAMEDGEDD